MKFISSGRVIDLDVGKRVRKRRKELGLSTYQVKDLTGVPQSHISNIENGKKNPTMDCLVKIAKGLDMDFIELVTGVKLPPFKS